MRGVQSDSREVPCSAACASCGSWHGGRAGVILERREQGAMASISRRV